MIYKLTNKHDRSKHGGCQWAEGAEYFADGKGDLCTKHWIHGYTDKYLAVICNPIHANYDETTMHMWECEGDIGKDDGIKLGCTRVKTIRQIEVPKITINQGICFAILAGKAVSRDDAWNKWADKWLDGTDRTRAAAYAAAAAYYGDAAAYDAAAAAAYYDAAYATAAAARAVASDLPALIRQAMEMEKADA